MIYLAPFILIAPIFLVLFGEYIADRIRARRVADLRQAWTGDHNREGQ